MDAKKLKEWVNSLPDDAEIHVFESVIMSIPIPEPYLHAIERSSIKPIKTFDGMMAGRVISSLHWKK